MLGTEVAGNDWTVVVNSVTFEATDQVLAANGFNETPAEGQEYVLVNYTVTYTGINPDGQAPALVTVDYVTPDGTTIRPGDTSTVAPDPIDTLTTLHSGEGATGNIVFLVPADSAADGVLAVQPDLIGEKTTVPLK